MVQTTPSQLVDVGWRWWCCSQGQDLDRNLLMFVVVLLNSSVQLLRSIGQWRYPPPEKDAPCATKADANDLVAAIRRQGATDARQTRSTARQDVRPATTENRAPSIVAPGLGRIKCGGAYFYIFRLHEDGHCQ